MQLRWTTPLLVLLSPAIARGESLTEEERQIVEARVENLIAASPKFTINAGDTVFLVKKKAVKATTLNKPITDYEAVVTGIIAPKGVVVHPRPDEVRFEKNGDETDVVFRYAIHTEPGTKGGGKVALKLKLLERTGLANTIAQIDVTHTIAIGPPSKPSARELLADFYAYRFFGPRAKARADRLAAAGFNVSMKDLAQPPPLDKLKDKGAAEVFQFLRDRTRMWIAHRHLVAAKADAYLANLGKRDDEIKGVPNVTLTDRGAQAEAPPPRSSGEAKVETLEPEAIEPAPGAEGGGGGKDDSSLKPVTSYEPGTEGDDDPTDLPESKERREEVPEDRSPAAPVTPGDQPAVARADTPEGTLELSEDPFAARQLREVTYINGFNRGLVLDDPNIAHGAAIRMAWANVTFPESAIASAFFFEGQVALTRSLGVELTIPTEFVDVDLEGSRSIFVMGNPLVSAKYRLFLPEVLGRRPALVIRARWALPISPLHNVPPTGFGAETFTREAHITDTYAFFLEKTALGLGLNLAWQWKFIYAGVQLYSDYFFPISGAADRSKFFTINYGFSVGALPFGDIIGAYIEGRSASLLFGPQRTEFFMYFGFRARLLNYLEPGVWVGLPLGSVADVSTVQFGGELRFSYDLAEILDAGTYTREDPLLK